MAGGHSFVPLFVVSGRCRRIVAGKGSSAGRRPVVKIVEKMLRAGEGRILQRLQGISVAGQRPRGRLREALRRRAARGDRPVPASGSPTARPSTTCCPRRSPPSARRAKRTLGQRHFDVQIMGGAALHLGNIAEMKTGEGKTLVATLPAYLNALDRQGRARHHGQRLPGRRTSPS